jgi:hypothetical protein
MLTVNAHWAIPVVAVDGAARGIDGDLVVIDAEPVALCMLVRGSRFTASLKSGKLSGSRRKNTGVLLPTRS